MNKTGSEIKTCFENIFKSDSLLIKSPGRINLIGEHTDYNDGYVLPAAINKSVYVAIQKRTDQNIHLFSTEYNEFYESSLDYLVQAKRGWPNYIVGAACQLLKCGYSISGFNLVVGGDIPIGSGVASSAALVCATVYALNEIFHLGISRIDMVKIAQKTEHDFIGVKCGIMDQFANMFGKKNNVMRLDCQSLDFEYFPFEIDKVKTVLFDTTIKHSLASSEYNLRREQCEKGVTCIRQKYPAVRSLRDVTPVILENSLEKNTVIYNRCKYVVNENGRLLEACQDLSKGDIKSVGKKMFDTHDGLSNLYEVSCKELDFLIDNVRSEKCVLGARMMGGGFGGCTINLVYEDAIPALIEKISEAYLATFQMELKYYIVEIDDGTCAIV